jgi:peptide/nickel transport system permease protein
MLEVLHEDYIRTAKASGLSRLRIILDHALRNALIPSVTMIGLAFGDLLYGAVFDMPMNISSAMSSIAMALRDAR